MSPMAGPGAFAAVGLFIVVIVAIGLFAARRSRVVPGADPRDEHELGGRSLPLLVLLGTLYATQYSGNSFVGFTGKAARDGYWFLYGPIIMQFVIVAYLVFAPQLFRLSREKSYRTPGDFLLDRFRHRGLHVLANLVMLFALLNFVLTQLVAIGNITMVFGGVHPAWGIFILAVLMVAYENLGGMRAVAWTDLLQGIILLAGATGLFLFLEFRMGGMAGALDTFVELWPERTGAPPAGRIVTWISGILMLGIGASVYPQAIQRIYAARSLGALKKSLAVMVFMPLVTTLPLVLVGIKAQAVAGPSRALGDQAMPFLLGQMLAWPLGAVIAVVVLTGAVSAMMSTADSALLTISSILNRDIVERYVFRGRSPRFYLSLGKAASWVVVLSLGGVATWSVTRGLTIWQILSIKMDLLMQVAPAIWIGVRTARLPGSAAFAGMLLGCVFTLAAWLGGSPKILGVAAGLWGLALNLGVCLIATARRP